MRAKSFKMLGLGLMLVGLSACGAWPLGPVLELAQRGPLPAGYPVPKAGESCRVEVSHAIGSSGSWRDEEMTAPQGWQPVSEGIGYKLVAVSERSNSGVILTVSDLTVGSAHHASQASITGGNEVSLGYSYTSGLADYSFDDSSSQGDITIEGESGGWRWGAFEGRLGKLYSRTLVLGKFGCRPQ